MIKNFIVIFDINSRLWEFTKFWYYISVWMWELNYIYIFTVRNMFSPLYSIKSTGEGFGKRWCNIFLIILDEWIWMIHFFIRGISGTASVKCPFMGECGLSTFEQKWDWWTIPQGTLWSCNGTLQKYQWPKHGFAQDICKYFTYVCFTYFLIKQLPCQRLS